MKLALITGGSRGLGKGLVDLYVEKGWTVREYSRSGRSSHHIDCDFSDAKASSETLTSSFAELSATEWDEIALINNAGTLGPIGPIHLDEPSQWQDNIQINLNSCISATGLFLKFFTHEDTKRNIANISSGAATKPYHGWSLYCAAKAAMEAFSRCVAVEQSRYSNPAQCFIIIPGVIDTQMQDLIRSQDVDRFENLQRFEKLKSDGELMPAITVAKAVIDIIESSPVGGESYDVRNYF